MTQKYIIESFNPLKNQHTIRMEYLTEAEAEMYKRWIENFEPDTNPVIKPQTNVSAIINN